MATRKRIRLTDAGIARLRPEEREFTVWDSRVPGLGVRVRPNGGKSYVLIRTVEGRTKRVSLGPVASRRVDDIRHECMSIKVESAVDGPRKTARAAPSFADFVGGGVAGGALGSLQAVDAKGNGGRSHEATPARVRGNAPRPDHATRNRALVRTLQPDRPGRCELDARPASADPELRDRVRTRRDQPGARRQEQPADADDPIPVPRGGPAPARGA